MTRISPERKSAALVKLLLPYNMPGTDKIPEQWPAEARLAVIIETATLSATEQAECYRKKGLYLEQIQQWKQTFLQTPDRDDKAEKQN